MHSVFYDTLSWLKYVKKIWLHKNIYLRKGVVVQQPYQVIMDILQYYTKTWEVIDA